VTFGYREAEVDELIEEIQTPGRAYKLTAKLKEWLFETGRVLG
jgi:hypothetical protein